MHRKDDLAPVSSILYQKFDMGFGSNGSVEIKFQIRFPLTAASWTESDPLHVEFDEKHFKSSRMMQDHGSNFEMLKHPFLKIWGQVSQWNAPQIGPVLLSHTFPGKWPLALQTVALHTWQALTSVLGHYGSFFLSKSLLEFQKCLEHTSKLENLGKTTWKQIHWLARFVAFQVILLRSKIRRWLYLRASQGPRKSSENQIVNRLVYVIDTMRLSRIPLKSQNT